MSFLRLSLLICLLLVQSSGYLYAKCKPPLQGPPGPPGPVGPLSTSDSLYDFNIEPTTTTIPAASSIPFNQPPLISGVSITEGLGNTYSFNESGTYFISFIGYTVAPNGGGVLFTLNGVPTGPNAITPPNGGALVLQQIINVQAADTLQVITTQISSFSGGTTGTISVIKLL